MGCGGRVTSDLAAHTFIFVRSWKEALPKKLRWDLVSRIPGMSHRDDTPSSTPATFLLKIWEAFRNIKQGHSKRHHKWFAIFHYHRWPANMYFVRCLEMYYSLQVKKTSRLQLWWTASRKWCTCWGCCSSYWPMARRKNLVLHLTNHLFCWYSGVEQFRQWDHTIKCQMSKVNMNEFSFSIHYKEIYQTAVWR